LHPSSALLAWLCCRGPASTGYCAWNVA